MNLKLSLRLILIIVLVAIISCLLIFIVNQNNENKETIERTEYVVKQYEEFIAAQLAERDRLTHDEKSKESYILYFDRVITDYYSKNPARRNNELNAEQRRNLLSIIYDFAKFPVANQSYIDEFLPLAYIRVESNGFYPYQTINGRKAPITGGSGEKSMFQFMELTAINTYRLAGREFIPNWYDSLEESVWVWFNGYKEFVRPFENAETNEERIRWAAYHYNRGGYKNELISYFNAGYTIEKHLEDYPIKKGNKNYNSEILYFYEEFKNGFEDS